MSAARYASIEKRFGLGTAPNHAFLALLRASDCADLRNLRPLAVQTFDPLAAA